MTWITEVERMQAQNQIEVDVSEQLAELQKRQQEKALKESLADLDNLLNAWEHLAIRERKVLLTLAWRIYAGQRRHGRLTLDKKDWNYEAIEEALDAAVYLGALLNDRTEKAFDAMVSEAEKEVTVVDPDWTVNTRSSR